MTLVPIIYTSLLIFSAFLLFVIIVSYISYKTKSREQILNRQVKVLQDDLFPKGFIRKEPRMILEPSAQLAFINNNSQAMKQIPVRVTHSNPPVARLASTFRQNSLQDPLREPASSADNLERAFQNSTVNRKSKYDGYSNPTHTIKNRIEILNHTENFKHSSTGDDYEAVAPFRFSEHSETNLLNFYSDIPEPDFVTLSAARGNSDV